MLWGKPVAMTNKTDRREGEKPKSARQERLKSALKENLKRRKAQARGRLADDAAQKVDTENKG